MVDDALERESVVEYIYTTNVLHEVDRRCEYFCCEELWSSVKI